MERLLYKAIRDNVGPIIGINGPSGDTRRFQHPNTTRPKCIHRFPTNDDTNHIQSIPGCIHPSSCAISCQSRQNTRHYPPPVRPSCPPSHTCTFEVGLSNEGGATDVFDLSTDMSNIPNGWSVGLAWTQTTSVLIRPNETIPALFTMTVPADAAPDTVVEFDMTLQAQNDSSRLDIKTIPISASMVSEASVALTKLIQPSNSTSRQVLKLY